MKPHTKYLLECLVIIDATLVSIKFTLLDLLLLAMLRTMCHAYHILDVSHRCGATIRDITALRIPLSV